MGNSRKNMTNYNSKIIEEKRNPLSQRAYYQKILLNKYHYDLNYPNMFANFKGNKKLTSKYNTLKNSPLASKKFRFEKRADDNLSFREVGNISKKNMLYTNENSIDNSKMNKEKSSMKKMSNNISKNGENLFIKKFEKIMNKKGQMTTQNKSKKKIMNYSVNNSFINFQKNFGNKYNNLNLNDKTFTTKANNLSKLREYNLSNNNYNNDMDIYKNKTNNNKNLMIDCGYYYSNKEKYNVSGDKYINKKKSYIYSLPCSTGKNINTNHSIKKEKEKEVIATISSKRTYVGVNSSLGSKYKNKIKPYIRSSLYKKKEKNNNIYKKVSKSRINSKRTADNSSTN
jgi:hypothetical protein